MLFKREGARLANMPSFESPVGVNETRNETIRIYSRAEVQEVVEHSKYYSRVKKPDEANTIINYRYNSIKKENFVFLKTE